MNAPKNCVICEQLLGATEFGVGSQLCSSAVCQFALRDHLRRELRCCAACGRLIHHSTSNQLFGTYCSRTECQNKSLQSMSGNAAFCRVCGIHLGPQSQFQNEYLCRSPFCQREDFSNKSAAKSLAWFHERAKRQSDVAKIALDRAFHVRPGLRQHPSLSVVVLPYLEHKLTVPSAARKSRVAIGLLKLATEAFAQVQQNVAPAEQEAAFETDREPAETNNVRLNVAACSTCGGRCCNLGGDGAFLSTEKFKEYFIANPCTIPDEAVAAYVAQIPSETYDGSCIFHGDSGCGLTRSQRSVTCNAYLCSSLQNLLNAKQEPSATYLMAASNYRDKDHSEPKVYRILHVSEKSETIISISSSDTGSDDA